MKAFSKKEKWGNATVKKVANMGHGNVCVSCGYWPNLNRSYIAFSTGGTGVVGEHVPGFEKLAKIEDTPMGDIEFAMRFSNEASIDVVIEKLQEAKDHLHRMKLEGK